MRDAGLAQLIAPTTSEEFLAKSWPNKPFVVHGLSGSVASLTQLPFLQSLDALLNSWPNLVQAHLPDVADESSAVDATPQDARKLFANRKASGLRASKNLATIDRPATPASATTPPSPWAARAVWGRVRPSPPRGVRARSCRPLRSVASQPAAGHPSTGRLRARPRANGAERLATATTRIGFAHRRRP